MNQLRLSKQEMVEAINGGALDGWAGSDIAIKDLTMEDKLLSEAATKKAGRETLGWLQEQQDYYMSSFAVAIIGQVKLAFLAELKSQGLWEQKEENGEQSKIE